MRERISLYIVGTPIGNLGDISNRAIKTLLEVDYILCEDTRVSGKLMSSIMADTRLMVYNDHNAELIIPRVLDSIMNGNKKFAIISDAGTPLISDPGYKLINACNENNIRYTTVPGGCSVISAVIMSGFPSDRFMFVGFANHKKFSELSKIYDSTLVMFESPKKIIKTLQLMIDFSDRKIAVIREMTKIYEEVIRGTPQEVTDHFTKNAPRGEMVVVISPKKADELQKLHEAKELILSLQAKMSDTEVCRILSGYFSIGKNTIYNFIKNNS